MLNSKPIGGIFNDLRKNSELKFKKGTVVESENWHKNAEDSLLRKIKKQLLLQ